MTSNIKSKTTFLYKVDHVLQLLLYKFFDKIAPYGRFLKWSPANQQRRSSIDLSATAAGKNGRWF